MSKMEIILYAIMASVHFAFMYCSLDKVYRARHVGAMYDIDETDRVFISVSTSIFFILTMWFTIPYVLIGLRDYKRIRSTHEKEINDRIMSVLEDESGILGDERSARVKASIADEIRRDLGMK